MLLENAPDTKTWIFLGKRDRRLTGLCLDSRKNVCQTREPAVTIWSRTCQSERFSQRYSLTYHVMRKPTFINEKHVTAEQTKCEYGNNFAASFTKICANAPPSPYRLIGGNANFANFECSSHFCCCVDLLKMQLEHAPEKLHSPTQTLWAAVFPYVTQWEHPPLFLIYVRWQSIQLRTLMRSIICPRETCDNRIDLIFTLVAIMFSGMSTFESLWRYYFYAPMQLKAIGGKACKVCRLLSKKKGFISHFKIIEKKRKEKKCWRRNLVYYSLLQCIFLGIHNHFFAAI